MTVDTQSQAFADMVRAVMAALEFPASEHPWTVIPAGEEGHIGISIDGGQMYFPAETLDEAAVGLADHLQDDVIDIYWRAVPTCLPGHPHPAKPVLSDGQALWICPKLGTVVRPMLDDAT